MVRTGTANLPLHPGRAPRWLFRRMVKLSRGIFEVISYEYGEEEFLKRISDPFWFQSLSCVLGFDWHSSGCTTVTCGALKEALEPEKYGFAIAGGKGKASLNTLDEITNIGETFSLSTEVIENLKYSSRISAKVDNTAVQDNHTLYHHVFFFCEKAKWAVIQQGMNSNTNYARRYHWLSDDVEDFISEPHQAILGKRDNNAVLDMTSNNSEETRKISIDLVKDNPQHLKHDWAALKRPRQQRTLEEWLPHKKQHNNNTTLLNSLNMPRSINWDAVKKIYEFQPTNYEEMLSLRGVGPSTVRALALISDLIYGSKPSWKDPVKFSFTVGGKDGVPYPVDKKTMDRSIDILKSGVNEAKIGKKEKIKALKRLRAIIPG